MDIEFRTTDVKKLQAKLDAVGPANKARAERALRKAAKDVERDAKLLVPVDTGALKNSIGIDQPSPSQAIIGPTMNYASYVERGTSRQAPQPYMRPAAERNVPLLARAVRDIGGDIL